MSQGQKSCAHLGVQPVKATSISELQSEPSYPRNIWMDCNKNLAQIWNVNGSGHIYWKTCGTRLSFNANVGLSIGDFNVKASVSDLMSYMSCCTHETRGLNVDRLNDRTH